MPLSACNSGRTTFVLFLNSSRTMFLQQRFAYSASAARAFDTTSRTRSLTTSTSTACMLLMMRSRRLPTRGKRKLPTAQPARQHSPLLERSCVLQRATTASDSNTSGCLHDSHRPFNMYSLFRSGLPRRSQQSRLLQVIMISFRAAVVGEPHITGLLYSERIRPLTSQGLEAPKYVTLACAGFLAQSAHRLVTLFLLYDTIRCARITRQRGPDNLHIVHT